MAIHWPRQLTIILGWLRRTDWLRLRPPQTEPAPDTARCSFRRHLWPSIHSFRRWTNGRLTMAGTAFGIQQDPRPTTIQRPMGKSEDTVIKPF